MLPELLTHIQGAVVVVMAGAFNSTPNDSFPGGDVLSKIVGGGMRWGQYAVVAGIVVGAVMWMVGSKSNNPQHASGGKLLLLASICGAILIGGANNIGSTFYDLGTQVK